MRPVQRKRPCILLFTFVHRSLTVIYRPPHAVKWASNASRPLHREHCKRLGAPDPDHRTCPEHPVLSVRVTHISEAAPNTPTRFNPRPVPGVRCLSVTRPGTDSTPDAQAEHPVPPWPASGASVANIRWHSCDFSKLPTTALEKMHFIFSRASNPVSQARREEERNPTSLYPSTSTSFSKCANTTKCTPRCAVLAFS